MRTARTKIDVYECTLSMEFDREKACFNIFDTMKHPYDNFYSIFMIDMVDPLVDYNFGIEHWKND